MNTNDKNLFDFSNLSNNNNSTEVMFAKENNTEIDIKPENINLWKFMIVDDEEMVHSATKLILNNYQIRGKKIKMIHAYSAKEAKSLLKKHPDIAVVILDVVMETDDAGLNLVKFIREELNNPYIRIILRTGQPGAAPEEDIVVIYDINDYKSKADLTAIRLKTSCITSIRSYESLISLDLLKQNLELKVYERTVEIQKANKQLKDANQKLQKLNSLKNEFLGMAAHDLRNPIGAIQTLSELIKMEIEEKSKENSSEILEYLSNIEEQSSFSLQLLNELLDINTIESGHLNINKTKNNYKEFIGKVIKLNQEMARKKGIAMSLDIQDNLPEIFFDVEAIRQVVNNLVTNAIKYSHSGSNIDINISKKDDFILTEIIDEGQGIPENEINNVFNPFQKTSVKATAGEKSIGLGLSIAKKIIENHGGEIAVKSKVKQGSDFYFTLPA